ncbi:MAG: DoxX family protein [Chthoniobacterales bacterium]
MNTIVQVCQIIVGLGLLNVWLLRRNRATSYRGGKAATMTEEFAAYGLPAWFCLCVGLLKVAAAIGLISGLLVPALTLPSAAVVVVLMIGAVAMHLKVQDPPRKSLPALAVLALSLVICAGRWAA